MAKWKMEFGMENLKHAFHTQRRKLKEQVEGMVSDSHVSDISTFNTDNCLVDLTLKQR